MRRRIWLALTIIAPIVAFVMINDAIRRGLTLSYSGHSVDIPWYLLELGGAVVLVCFAIYAGIRSRK